MGKRKQKKTQSSRLDDFFAKLELMLGKRKAEEVKKFMVEKPTTFRVNTLKATKQEVLEALQAGGCKVTSVPWYTDAFILQNKSKRELMALPIYERGGIYIQSLASMVPPLVLEPKSGETVLDLTAAPGSKTSQIAAMMEKQGILDANDVNKVRFFKLKHNMELLGVSDEAEGWEFHLSMLHGSELCSKNQEKYDKILLDAPCSAEARFVLDNPKSFGFWSDRKVKEMAHKQRQLLFSAWHALKPGGTLVYSTCTMSPEENEIQVARLLRRMPDAKIESITLDVSGHPAILSWKDHTLPEELKKTLRVAPSATIEGFYIAKITKL